MLSNKKMYLFMMFDLYKANNTKMQMYIRFRVRKIKRRKDEIDKAGNGRPRLP